MNAYMQEEEKEKEKERNASGHDLQPEEQSFLILIWVGAYSGAIILLIYNYLQENPAKDNWDSWFLWAIATVVAIIIYINEEFPNPNNPDSSKDPKKPSHRHLYLIACILFVVLIISHSAFYYFASRDFNLHRDQIMHVDCNNHIQTFLNKKRKASPHSARKYISELSDTVPRAKNGLRCVVAQERVEGTLGLLEWFFLVGDYYGAVGTATIVMNNSAIEAKATWLPIVSPWYKHGDTRLTRIEAVSSGRVSCNYSHFTKSLSADFNLDPPKETRDDFFIALADLTGTSDGEHVQIEGMAQVFLDRIRLRSISANSGLLNLQFSRQEPFQNKKTFAYKYLCKQQKNRK